VVAADVHTLTVRLAGTFTPTDEMRADAKRSGELTQQLLERAAASTRLRHGVVVGDVELILESCAAIRVPDQERTQVLRRRHLHLLLDGLSATDGGRLPGPGPQPEELNLRWRTTP
jgi:hypothetical protein